MAGLTLNAMPHPFNGAWEAAQIWSTATYEVQCLWKVSDGNLRVGKKLHSASQRTGWTWFDVTGAAATEMALPVENDDHCFLNIMVDDNGIIHIIGNMHDDVLRYIVSTNPNDITAWSVPAALASEQPRNTYPKFSGRTPHGYEFDIRAGPENVGGAAGDNRSGVGNSMNWILPLGSSTFGNPGNTYQGVSVPGAGPGGSVGTNFLTPDEYNWSCYNSAAFVEPDDYPHPGRLWKAGVWRAGVNDPVTTVPGYPEDGARTNEMPFCEYTDDVSNINAWKAVDGTAITKPLVPYLAGVIETAANPAAYIPWPRPDDWPLSGYLNQLGICVHPTTGFPVVTLSMQPYFRFEWDGDSWSRTILGSALGYTLAGASIIANINPYYLDDGELWYLCNRIMPDTGRRRPHLVRADGSNFILLGGEVYDPSLPVFPGAGSGWAVLADPEAFRRWHRITVSTPNGDYPQSFHYGDGPRELIAP